MSWRLRRAGIDDLDAIMELEEQTFEAEAWSRESMARELEQPYCYYVVGVDADGAPGIAGYGGLLCPEGTRDADIQTIAVAEPARGTGLGRQIMTRLISKAATRRARTVFLEVRADNPVAQQLYRSLGFEEIAVRPGYYQPEGIDALVMRHDIPPAGGASAPATAPDAEVGR